MESREQRLLLLRLRGVMRGFQNDLEGHWIQFGRRSENAVVTFGNDPILRGEAINDLALVAREDFFSGPQGGFEQAFGEHRATDESIDPVAAVIGVERNQPVELPRPN